MSPYSPRFYQARNHGALARRIETARIKLPGQRVVPEQSVRFTHQKQSLNKLIGGARGGTCFEIFRHLGGQHIRGRPTPQHIELGSFAENSGGLVPVRARQQAESFQEIKITLKGRPGAAQAHANFMRCGERIFVPVCKVQDQNLPAPGP